ncbi:unnamed protein product [Periconia digitata]|uniref:Uncharacterized protein n=1 Tax=Periconia digitata TaxID=1303443 RepID=A0A9W4XRQ8_9PLEO|nr:unnamed protein product [Periconia digitata]
MSVAEYSRWRGLYFAAKSQIQYFDSRDAYTTNESHDDYSLESKLKSSSRSISQDGTDIPKTENAATFTLMTAVGDPSEPDTPLRLSSSMLLSLIECKLVHPDIEAVYRTVRPHCSYYVEYDEDQTTPESLYILVRVLTRTDSIHCSLKITLETLSTTCLLSSSTSTITDALRAQCIQSLDLIQQSPLHLLRFILDHARDDLEAWLLHQWHRIELLEDSTWMTPGHPFPRNGDRRQQVVDSLARGLTTLLRELHAVNRESRIALTVVWAAVGLCEDLGRMVEEVESLRSSAGLEAMKPGHRAFLDGRVKFVDAVLRGMAEKNRQLLDRMGAQINLVYSFIAQKGNEQNYQIARLTANDSRTMKTITVLTLTFLPGTMLASLWDAGIFSMEQGTSWRVYVGATMALTLIVYAIWALYEWVSRKRDARRF